MYMYNIYSDGGPLGLYLIYIESPSKQAALLCSALLCSVLFCSVLSTIIAGNNTYVVMIGVRRKVRHISLIDNIIFILRTYIHSYN